ncbi:predicted protein [Histoplasma mississippiense (nom. inval.)]|uniref:predicted protein n=1 Tax=Ajellomyces capsulatus (strain NAm1 / WU24) TaxID=2059318 RepID=UPI000157C4F8|nr:predicted protein [Histoplasma mississippiense (nom. inval.)]EDN08518.1 predicted protein [Histoplasma mississippiense (nom. inval.)]
MGDSRPTIPLYMRVPELGVFRGTLTSPEYNHVILLNFSRARFSIPLNEGDDGCETENFRHHIPMRTASGEMSEIQLGQKEPGLEWPLSGVPLQ